jgi:four helix bundle protein
MEASKNFAELHVWQKAHQFVLKTYVVAKKFPKEEMYGLSSQFRRAAVTVAANIAEGFRQKRHQEQMQVSQYFTKLTARMQIFLDSVHRFELSDRPYNE